MQKYACGKEEAWKLPKCFNNLGATDILLFRLTNLLVNNKVKGSNTQS